MNEPTSSFLFAPPLSLSSTAGENANARSGGGGIMPDCLSLSGRSSGRSAAHRSVIKGNC